MLMVTYCPLISASLVFRSVILMIAALLVKVGVVANESPSRLTE
jgi:hypothetical protein